MANLNSVEQFNQEISQDLVELNNEELDAVAGGHHNRTMSHRAFTNGNGTIHIGPLRRNGRFFAHELVHTQQARKPR